MKILYICHDSDLGGANRSLLDLIRHIKKYVDLQIVLPREGKMESCLSKENIKYHVISFLTTMNDVGEQESDSCGRIASNFESAKRIAELAIDEKIDIIHSNSSVTDAGALAAIMTNIPHVWHVREDIERHFGQQYSFDQRTKKLLFDRSCNIAISQTIGKSLSKKNVQYKILYDGIESKKGSELQAQEIINTETPILIMVGTVCKEKGHITAVKAVGVLKRKGINVKLYIIGNGEYRFVNALKLFAAYNNLLDDIVFVSETEDLLWYREQASAALVCSKYEALGRTTVESMQAEIPVVGANTGGTAELIGENEERGYLFEWNSAVSLAEKIEKCLYDSGKNEKTQAAYEYVNDLFDPEVYAKTIADLYIHISDTYLKSEYEDKILLDTVLNIIKPASGMTDCITKVTDKYQRLYQICRRIMIYIQENNGLRKAFDQRGIKSVAIYGMGFIGCYVAESIVKSGLEIRYVIDRYPLEYWKELEIRSYNVDDELPEVDAIIITIAADNTELISQFRNKYKYKILDIDELLQ